MHARRPELSALAVLALAIGVASPSRAYADEPTEEPPPAPRLRLPVSSAQRPLTIPELVLNPAMDFAAVHQGAQAGTYADLDGSVAIGLTDDLTLGALALPLQLAGPGANGFRYGQNVGNRGPSLDGRYRFVRGPVVELAAGLTLRIFTLPGIRGSAIIPSVPVRFHVTDALRIDVVPAVNITRATQTTGPRAPADAVRINVPVSVLYNITEPLDVGVTSGLTIYDVNDTKNTTGVPLGAFVGYAIAGTHGPVLDLGPFFTFPYLVMPGRATVTNTAQYVVGASLVGHVYL